MHARGSWRQAQQLHERSRNPPPPAAQTVACAESHSRSLGAPGSAYHGSTERRSDVPVLPCKLMSQKRARRNGGGVTAAPPTAATCGLDQAVASKLGGRAPAPSNSALSRRYIPPRVSRHTSRNSPGSGRRAPGGASAERILRGCVNKNSTSVQLSATRREANHGHRPL